MKKNPYNSKKTFSIAEDERAGRNQQLGQVNDVADSSLRAADNNAQGIRDTARETAGQMRTVSSENADRLRNLASGEARGYRDLADQSANLNRGVADENYWRQTGLADKNAGAVNPALERYYDPSGAGMSTWKKGQINTREKSANRAFNDTLAGTKRRAQLSGFGYNQAADQAGETNVELGRADALSRIRGDVEAEAVPIEMQAINQRMQSGAQQGSQYATAGGQRLGAFGQASGQQLDAHGQALGQELNAYGTAGGQELTGWTNAGQQELGGEEEASRQQLGAYGDAGRLKLGVAGEYSPEQYYGYGVNQAEAEAKRRGSMWKNLGKFGLDLAGKLYPPAAPFTSSAEKGLGD